MAAYCEDGILTGTPYRAHRVVGRGGMALVLEAEDMRTGRAAVVKVLRPEVAEREDIASRLRVEGAALHALRHPNLVEVMDWGVTADGRGYVVMEQLSGRDLREELDARGALPPSVVIELALQALAGLAALHARGIVHRDVKPANLFLCTNRDGGVVVKLLDLGVAKITAELSGVDPRRATGKGQLVGTPWFVAPELLQGRAATPAADVYAIGLVLYEMLTGRHPFIASATVDELWQAHLCSMPPLPSTLTAEPLHASLERAVMRALAKEPSDRFADAAELASALEGDTTAPSTVETVRSAVGAAKSDDVAPLAPELRTIPRGPLPPAATLLSPIRIRTVVARRASPGRELVLLTCIGAAAAGLVVSLGLLILALLG